MFCTEMKKLLYMQKFMETAMEHKFDISKRNFVIRRMISFSYFLAKQQSSFIELRGKAIPSPTQMKSIMFCYQDTYKRIVLQWKICQIS